MPNEGTGGGSNEHREHLCVFPPKTGFEWFGTFTS